jgi:hypothetical protein
VNATATKCFVTTPGPPTVERPRSILQFLGSNGSVSPLEILNKDRRFSAGSRTLSVTRGRGPSALAGSSRETEITGWILNDGGSLSS